MWVSRHLRELRMSPRFVVWAMAWAREAEYNEFGCEDIVFECFRCSCLIRVGNIRLEFNREIRAAVTDLKFISILLLTKSREVNFLALGEYTKQEKKTGRRTLGKVNKSQDRTVLRKLREDKESTWRGCR